MAIIPKLPFDIGAVLKEAMQVDEARATPLVVTVYLDETAPADLRAFVRSEFASSSPSAQVNIVSFPSFPVIALPGSDVAVLVAGLDECVGLYVQTLREAGIPVMVVTTLPEPVVELAAYSGYPLLTDDVVYPRVKEVESARASAEAGARARASAGAGVKARASGGDGVGTRASAEAGVAGTPVCFLTAETKNDLRRRMGDWVITACRPKRLAFALAFPFVRKPLSLESIRATAMQNACIGAIVFIPGADLPVMTLNQMKMLLQMAAAYGQPMDKGRVKELAFVVGGAFACRSLARSFVGLVPVLGWALKASIGYGGTLAIGQAALEYFEADGRIDRLAGVVGRARDKAVRLYRTQRIKRSRRL